MRFLSLAVLSLSLFACGDPADGSKAGAPAENGSASGGGAGPVFRFSAIPDEKATENDIRFVPAANYLAEKLGVKVEYVPVNDYPASVQAFRNSDVQAAWFGGLSGVQARLAVPGSEAIVQGDTDPTFYSYFIAHKDSGLEPGDDFPMEAKGKTFTFGSVGSTSGRLMPEYFIRQATGKEPKDFFREVGFSGTHPKTLAQVNSGAVQVGVLNYTVYDKAKPEEKANTIVIWKTPTYADYNFTVRADLDETFGQGFKEKLKAALLAMPSDLTERCFTRKKLIPASNADFQGIEETAKSLGLAR